MSVLIVGAFLLLAPSLEAQNNLLDLRFLEFNDDGKRTYHNFIYSRSLGDSRLSIESFWLFLPQEDEYDEIALGVGYRAAKLGQANISLIGYFSFASDDDYFQPTLFLIDTEGNLAWSLFLLHYIPLGDDGAHQWLIDPIEIQYSVSRRISIGASGYFYRPQAGSWLSKIGPKISLSDRVGASELAIRWVSDGGGAEIQLRRLLAF